MTHPLYSAQTQEQPAHLPVIQSLFSADALKSMVNVDYAVEPPVSCQLLAHNLNDTYLVPMNASKYILRIYQAPRPVGRTWRSESEIRYELDLLLHLKRKGMAVSAPLARKDGTLLRVLEAPEGPRAAVLFTYADGDPVTPPRQHSTLSQLYGRAVAELHTASSDFSSPHRRFQLDLAFLLDIPLQTIQPVLAHRQDDWNYVLRLAEALKKHIARFAPDLESGVCHGDVNGGNATLTGEQTLTFFDFDVCGQGWRAYDLAVFYWGAAMGKSRLGWSDEQVERLWTAYLEGYLERRSLSEPDLQAIPLFVVLRHFWFLGIQTANWDYWGSGEISDQSLDRELAFLRAWASTLALDA